MPIRIPRFASRRSLARELTVVLAVKIALIVLAGVFLFDAGHRLHVDQDVIASHMFDQNPPPTAR